MNLQQVVAAGRSGLLFTIATIAGTLLLGFLIGRALRMTPATSHLISSGTAICGGSWGGITWAARRGLTLTLFLIGAGLSRKALVSVGVRPLLLGIILWIAISVVSLFGVRGAV